MRFKRLISTALVLAFAPVAAFAQVPVDGGINFQEAATPVMEATENLHNWVFLLMLGVVLFVMVLMAFILFRFSEKRNPVPSKTSHNTAIEIVWTIVPVIILLFLVVPSMQLLRFQDVIPEADMTLKVTGNTWNWEYAYPDYENVDSIISNYLLEDDAKAAGKPYLLGTDAPVVVPVDTIVKVLVTSSNNLHSFAVPSFGVKIDAIPGKINQTWFKVTKEGTFYGQCSELCGLKHAFMPIEVKVVSKDAFRQWVANDGAFSTSSASNNSGGVATATAPK